MTCNGKCESKPQTVKLSYKKLLIGNFLIFALENSVQVSSRSMGITFYASKNVLMVKIESGTKK